MALVQRPCTRLGFLFPRLNLRAFSKTESLKEDDIKKSVFISQSNDIYTNLALEEWLFKNFNFKQHHLLLLCQNNPSVVIGKHQNPWSETNFSDANNLERKGVKLARRSSGGGASYHDKGSLSMSFFSPRERHNSRYNMEIVARSVFREFGCEISVNPEEELVLRHNKPISSKAAKLGRDNSYYNLSLMIRTNKVNRNMALQKQDFALNTKARVLPTTSKVMNLCEETPEISVAAAMKAIGWEFLRTKALTIKDGGMELAFKQKGFHLINPTDKWFPGLNEIRNTYASWEWCFGQTPQFKIVRSFTVPVDLLHGNSGSSATLNITISVENGLISDITVFVPYGFKSFGFTGEAKVIHNLKGKRFSLQAFEELESSLDCLLDEKDKFVTECVKQVMSCA
ncbi:hypothetical protein ABEB36_010933 [Hypothenemus hampei]|uniref:BPL/LPL catalytic domain-containing protein n=1 Tax=Hypothenemus hampei TaxID=57062 RepID=A0ABD1EDU7_HYPHA